MVYVKETSLGKLTVSAYGGSLILKWHNGNSMDSSWYFENKEVREFRNDFNKLVDEFLEKGGES